MEEDASQRLSLKTDSVYFFQDNKRNTFKNTQSPDNRKCQTTMMRSTDFASKGLYKQTSVGSKSQSVFKDVANLRLNGNTFDAKHLDKFLQHSQFTLSGSPSQVKLAQSKCNYATSPISKQVRESSMFQSIDREHKGQMRVYFDQYDGPSSLMKRDEHKTIKETLGGEKYIYDNEIEQLQKLNKDYKDVQKILYEDDASALKTPKQRFLESVQYKNEVQRLKNEKQHQMFVNKRDRVIKCGWRHGILGVENPDDPGTEFYKSVQEDRNYKQQEKQNINDYRYRKLVKNGEVSSQIDFARAGINNESRKDPNIVAMYPHWTSKQVSPIRFQNTHEDLFKAIEPRQNPLRASKLKLEEKRDRPYNIISGRNESII